MRASLDVGAARAPKLLPRDFYLRDVRQVARELLGKTLWHQTPQGVCAGIIVETEAYLGAEDAASHAFRGVTPRTQAMFERGGIAYVYFTYGAHYCVNVVTGPAGQASAVLIRALEPTVGLELMAARRKRDAAIELCSGPGKLTQALAIGPQLNRADLRSSALRLREGRAVASSEVLCGPRVGITKAKDEPYRFWLAHSAYVSGARRLTPRKTAAKLKL